MRKEPIPEQFTAIIDTREQRPLDLSPLKVQRGTLVTGDYSIKGLENHICIERKSLDDYVACCGRERERFMKECKRMLGYPVRAIIIEANQTDLEAGTWRSKISVEQVRGNTARFISMGIPLHLAGNHEYAGIFTARLLFLAAKERYKENLNFMEGL